MLEGTQDSSAATAWHGSAQGTEWTPTDSLRVNMSRLLQRVAQREGYAFCAKQTIQRQTKHLRLIKERVEEERESVLVAKTKKTSPRHYPLEKRLLEQLQV